ncbi:DUF4294 domain-containing protein [Flavobacterium sp.]|uniref:DUF4294 domain-containing protein n=1 Tax=Flavobacterium sp. TaxID=239 RepID=UPI00286D7C0C|nr:DUF4294 domain-containing protein [Flavobacterium sp.]
MKYIQLFIVIFLISFAANSQVVKKDTIEVEAPLVGTDTISNMPIELENVLITNRHYIKSEDERKRYLILKRRVLKVYPYAKTAADRLTALNNGMKGLKSERDKKKFFKLVENYLTNEFEGQLKKLSRKDGQILVKLIHRQTGASTFDLIKELKSGWKAFWSNNTARLFDINLKTKYQPYTVSEDFIIESILYKAFSDGTLVNQQSKVEMNYADLATQWREKIKALKAEK